MCLLTSGRTEPCKNLIGGTSKAFFINFVENPFTVTAGQATAINPLVLEVFEYELRGDGSTFEESKASDKNNGTSINTQTLTLALKGVTLADNVQMNLLTAGRPIVVIKDRNGKYRAVGITDGIDFTVVSSTGGAKADFNGYTLTGVSEEADLAPILDSATVTALLALV